MITFDTILEKHLGMGKFQNRSFAVVSLIDFSDGIEKQIIGILLTVLANEWHLDKDQVSSLASAYFIGIVSGTMSCAFFGDKIGRQKTLLYSGFFGFICMLWMSIAKSFYEIYFLRIFFGFIFGTTIYLGHIVITEIVPAAIRGFIMSLIATIFILGKIYSTGLCMLLLDGFEGGHWRILVAINSIPLFACFLGTHLFIKESPRYYMSKGQYEDAFREIEAIALINKQQFFKLTQEEKDGLIESSYKISQPVQFVNLFKGKNGNFTIKMWVVFILTSIIETSSFILMPFWLNQSKKGFTWILYMLVAELIANLCIQQVIDSNKYGGRTKLLSLLSFIISIVCFSMYYIKEQSLVIGLAMISFFVKMIFTTEMVIMNENYTTQYRSLGVGMTQTVGKLVGAVIPYVIFPIYYQDPYIPFLIYGVSMIILTVISLTFPFDMTQRELDCQDVFGSTNVADSLLIQ